MTRLSSPMLCLAVAALVAFAGVAMAQEEPMAPGAKRLETCRSLIDVVDSLDFLSTFQRAINETGLNTAFNRSDIRATILAPSNGAFNHAARELGVTTEDLFSNQLALRRLIQNHVIPGMIETMGVEDSTALYATMDFGNYAKITVRNGELFVESEDGVYSSFGTEILHNICANVKLYVVSKVLLPVELQNSEVFKTADDGEVDEDAAPSGFFSGLFGGASTGAATDSSARASDATTTGFRPFGGFGAAPAAGGLFSGGAGATAPAGGLFSGGAGATAPGGLFSGGAGATAPGGLFSGGAGAAAPGGLFSGGAGATAPGGLFSGAAGATAPGGLFSGGAGGFGSGATAPGGLFSGGAGATAPAGGLFSGGAGGFGAGATAPVGLLSGGASPGAAGSLTDVLPTVDLAAADGLPASFDPASFTGFGAPPAGPSTASGPAGLFAGPFSGLGSAGGTAGSALGGLGAGGLPTGSAFGGLGSTGFAGGSPFSGLASAGGATGGLPFASLGSQPATASGAAASGVSAAAAPAAAGLAGAQAS